MADKDSTSPRLFITSDCLDGTAVYDTSGRRVGTIKRLITEKLSGQVSYVVISVGGFLNLGNENHAVPWGKFKYDVELEGYRTDISEDELRSAPDFAQGDDHDLSDPEHESELHAYWRIPPSSRAI
jgi:hypothetical protein